MKDLNRLTLFKDGEPVGTIERTADGCRIAYDAGAFAMMSSEHNWKGLTFNIPWSDHSLDFAGASLPPYFVGLLPEGLRMRALVRKLKTSEDDYFSLLAAAGTDPIGSVHFAIDTSLSDGENQRNSRDDFSKLDFKELRQALVRGDAQGEPVAGIQEKISGSRITYRFPRTHEATILKFASPDLPDLVENETACLELASKCGLEVNTAHVVVDQNGESALAVTRFDRTWDTNDSKWKRFHVEDSCQFLNLYPADKYRVSLQVIAAKIAALSFTPELEILSLLRLYAFSYLCGNGDLHAKNISLIQRGPAAGITVSPAYDLVCTALYGDFRMALKLDGKDTNLQRGDFVRFGARHGLSKILVDSMLDRLLDGFTEHVGIMYSVPFAGRNSKMLEEMWKRRIAALSGQ